METDDEGNEVKVDCIIPIIQNNANIHYDLKTLANKVVKEGKAVREIEKLRNGGSRSYDPCISCSVH